MAFEASEIAALMADRRLWKDLVVALLRASKSSQVKSFLSAILAMTKFHLFGKKNHNRRYMALRLLWIEMESEMMV